MNDVFCRDGTCIGPRGRGAAPKFPKMKTAASEVGIISISKPFLRGDDGGECERLCDSVMRSSVCKAALMGRDIIE